MSAEAELCPHMACHGSLAVARLLLKYTPNRASGPIGTPLVGRVTPYTQYNCPLTVHVIRSSTVRSPQPPSARCTVCRPSAADVSLSLRLCHRRWLLPSHLVFPTQTEHRGELPSTAVVAGRRKDHLSLPSSISGHGIKELTFKFSGSAAGLFGDSFPLLGGNATASCSLCAIGCKELLADRPRCWMYVVVIGLDIDHGVWSGKDDGLVWTEGTRLICASFGSTRLICASFESTRLICASLGITRLIGVSFGITRLICAFYGITRLLCRVRVQRGADRREAGRMREGHMDASGFLYASADVFCENIWFCDFELMT
ncbi:hypothetical protein E6C27_scaffold54G001430 [Cucumis melo var. makuwa]|uniref:Ty3-gypsy retrotransposon protein n=1 Tax=Cucumis melo var. makuwa TaxID=1194695 RepID=A0A5A7UWX3_CUCMM|nr:hypothetical protein E6C27_scaffold54G001430 [Cucumis melo var. makuwa]